VFTYIAGYRDVEADHSQDVDGTQFDMYVIRNVSEQDQKSHELRYASAFSERFDFTVGLYYLDASQVANESRRVFGVSQIATRGELDLETYAAFFDADIHLTDRWTVAVGGRYTNDEKTASTAPFGSCAYDFSSCQMGAPADESWSNFSPRAAVQYQLDTHELAYFSVTRGFRSGGFDQRGQPLRDPYDPEEVTAFEAGFKGDFMDGRLRTNVAIFHNEYQDLQRNLQISSPTQGSYQQTLNAADATMDGVELELSYALTDALTLSGTYGYIDASYDKFEGFNPNGGTTPDPEAAKALDLPLTPDQTFSLVASYRLAIGDAGDLTFRLADSYRAGQFADLPNKAPLPSSNVVDASATFSAASGGWYAMLYGKNAGSEEYATWAGPLGAIGLIHLQGPPAEYGLKLGVNF
jgi:iron complex outermembrane receptor protein